MSSNGTLSKVGKSAGPDPQEKAKAAVWWAAASGPFHAVRREGE